MLTYAPLAHTRPLLALLYLLYLDTSAYVSIRQHTSAYSAELARLYLLYLHASAYVSIRQHTSAYSAELAHLYLLYLHICSSMRTHIS